MLRVQQKVVLPGLDRAGHAQRHRGRLPDPGISARLQLRRRRVGAPAGGERAAPQLLHELVRDLHRDQDERGQPRGVVELYEKLEGGQGGGVGGVDHPYPGEFQRLPCCRPLAIECLLRVDRLEDAPRHRHWEDPCSCGRGWPRPRARTRSRSAQGTSPRTGCGFTSVARRRPSPSNRITPFRTLCLPAGADPTRRAGTALRTSAASVCGVRSA